MIEPLEAEGMVDYNNDNVFTAKWKDDNGTHTIRVEANFDYDDYSVLAGGMLASAGAPPIATNKTKIFKWECVGCRTESLSPTVKPWSIIDDALNEMSKIGQSKYDRRALFLALLILSEDKDAKENFMKAMDIWKTTFKESCSLDEYLEQM